MKPLLIFLDQNKWIDLARAYHEHKNGLQYKPILKQLMLTISKQKAILPLASTHIIETRKERNLARRKRLAQVMIELSQGWTLADPTYSVPLELGTVIGNTFNGSPIIWPTMLGRGIHFAFGVSEKELQESLKLSDEQFSVFLQRTDSPIALASFLIGHDETNNIQAILNHENRAKIFAKNVETARIAGKPYSRDMRKRAYVANLTYSLQTTLAKILIQHGKSIEDFMALGKDKLMAFFEQISTLNVQIELDTERDENLNKPIDPNDMNDVSFLGVAIPYCDIVVTEKFWGSLAKRKHLDKKYNTIILTNLLELENYLHKNAAYRCNTVSSSRTLKL